MTRERSEAVAVLDEFDKLVRKANAVPLTDQVRLSRRKVDSLLDRLRTALDDGPSELPGMLEELEQLVRTAKQVPLTNEIRVGRGAIYDLLDRMRAGAAPDGRDVLLTTKAPPEVVAVLEELAEFIGNSRLVPLSAQVRLDRRELSILLERLRTALNHPPVELASALDELDEFVQRAKQIPFTKEIRVGLVEIYDLLDRLLAALNSTGADA